MKWRAFEYEGQVYDLSHTHPFDHTFAVEIEGKLREFKCHIVISHHVFTRQRGNVCDENLIYSIPGVPREQREFDFERFELSKNLPSIIRGFGDKKCKRTNKGNYFRAELLNNHSEFVNYEIYFRVVKPDQRGWITMNVESAYVSDDPEKAKKKESRWRSIRFALIARNTLERRKIKG